MSIIRTIKKENPFVQVDKQYIGDAGLSLKATGLLTYILSKPDNWQIYMKDIQNRFTDGETSVRSAMNELVNAGYVNKYRERNEDGTFGNMIYDVYERPEFNPRLNGNVIEPKRDFSMQDKPKQEKQAYSNNQLTNNESNNNLESESKTDSTLDELLNEFTPQLNERNKVFNDITTQAIQQIKYFYMKHKPSVTVMKSILLRVCQYAGKIERIGGFLIATMSLILKENKSRGTKPFNQSYKSRNSINNRNKLDNRRSLLVDARSQYEDDTEGYSDAELLAMREAAKQEIAELMAQGA